MLTEAVILLADIGVGLLILGTLMGSVLLLNFFSGEN